MAQASQLLPKLSRFAGKLIAGTGVSAKDATIATLRGSARIAGECAREFVDGLKEGKNTAVRGDTDGDLTERVMDARKVG